MRAWSAEPSHVPHLQSQRVFMNCFAVSLHSDRAKLQKASLEALDLEAVVGS